MVAPDLVVVGGGLAGLTAGLFAARAGRSTIVLTDDVGGHLVAINTIDDFPGFPDGVAGYDLCPIVEDQATKAGAVVRAGHVEGLERQDDRWSLTTGDDETYGAGAVIVATGSTIQGLGVGEDRFVGRGVSTCASCDGPLFRGRAVGVVGGGDSAFQAALELAAVAARVIVMFDHEAPNAQDVYQRAVRSHPSIDLSPRSRVDALLGVGALEGVRVLDLDTGDVGTLELSALFPFVGLVPRTELLRDVVELEPSGHVRTDGSMRTSAVGVFAAGDIRTESARQAVAAAGDGATAALAAHRFLHGEPWPA